MLVAMFLRGTTRGLLNAHRRVPPRVRPMIASQSGDKRIR